MPSTCIKPRPMLLQTYERNFAYMQHYRDIPLILSRNVIFAEMGKNGQCREHISPDNVAIVRGRLLNLNIGF